MGAKTFLLPLVSLFLVVGCSAEPGAGPNVDGEGPVYSTGGGAGAGAGQGGRPGGQEGQGGSAVAGEGGEDGPATALAGTGSAGEETAAGGPGGSGDGGDGGGTAGSAGGAEDGGGTGFGCALGEVGSFATDETLDLFGEIVYFAGSQELPAGHYRVTYLDGCMKYNALFPWTVNSSAGNDGWWLVGDTSDDRLFVLPGPASVTPLDGYPVFEDCVDAGLAVEPVQFDFDGGRLGVWLNDFPYQDNLAGEGGRNPKWELQLLAEECPPEIVLE